MAQPEVVALALNDTAVPTLPVPETVAWQVTVQPLPPPTAITRWVSVVDAALASVTFKVTEKFPETA